MTSAEYKVHRKTHNGRVGASIAESSLTVCEVML